MDPDGADTATRPPQREAALEPGDGRSPHTPSSWLGSDSSNAIMKRQAERSQRGRARRDRERLKSKLRC